MTRRPGQERTPRRWPWRVSGATVALLLLLGLFLAVTRYAPPPVKSIPVHNAGRARPIPAGAPLKVMTWNVQFMAGNRNNDFFFSGGPDPWPRRETVLQTIRGVAGVIRSEDPDLILLQEVDLDSKRTHRIDELAVLLEQLPDTYVATAHAYYWKTPFLPHPAVFGCMGMALVVISKYRLGNATRYAMPYELELDFVTRQYIFKRAVLAVEMPLEGPGDRTLTVLDTHLSSFRGAYHIPTMEAQVGTVDRLMKAAEAAGRPALVGGDFNLLPTRESFDRVGPEDRGLYHADREELRPLFEHFAAAPSREAVSGTAYADWYTQSSLKRRDKVLDKTIDYLFFTRSMTIASAHVVQSALALSDHVPVVVTVRLP